MVFALLAALVSGCSGPDKSLNPAPRQEIHAPAYRAVSVSDADAGAPIALAASQELVVRLPTAVIDGLEWSLVDLQPAGVVAVSTRVFERVPRGVDVESGGDTVWRLKAMAAGTAALRFELRRPRSLDPATRVVTYIVTVGGLAPAASATGRVLQ